MITDGFLVARAESCLRLWCAMERERVVRQLPISCLIRMCQNPTGFYFPYKGEAGFGLVGFSEPMGKV